MHMTHSGRNPEVVVVDSCINEKFLILPRRLYDRRISYLRTIYRNDNLYITSSPPTVCRETVSYRNTGWKKKNNLFPKDIYGARRKKDHENIWSIDLCGGLDMNDRLFHQTIETMNFLLKGEGNMLRCDLPRRSLTPPLPVYNWWVRKSLSRETELSAISEILLYFPASFSITHV